MKKTILGLAFVATVLVSCEDKNKKVDENKVDSLATKTEQVIDSSTTKAEEVIDSTTIKANVTVEKTKETTKK